MTAVEQKLKSLELAVSRQRLLLLASLFACAGVWMLGAASNKEAETVNAKELIIRDKNGKVIGYFGPDGKEGEMTVLLKTKTDRFVKMSVTGEASKIEAGFDENTFAAQLTDTWSQQELTNKKGSSVEIQANRISSVALRNEPGDTIRALLASDPEFGAMLSLEKADGSERWKSPK